MTTENHTDYVVRKQLGDGSYSEWFAVRSSDHLAMLRQKAKTYPGLVQIAKPVMEQQDTEKPFEGRIGVGNWQPIPPGMLAVWQDAYRHEPEKYRLREIGAPLTARDIADAMVEAQIIQCDSNDPTGGSIVAGPVVERLHVMFKLLRVEV